MPVALGAGLSLPLSLDLSADFLSGFWRLSRVRSSGVKFLLITGFL